MHFEFAVTGPFAADVPHGERQSGAAGPRRRLPQLSGVHRRCASSSKRTCRWRRGSAAARPMPRRRCAAWRRPWRSIARMASCISSRCGSAPMFRSACDRKPAACADAGEHLSSHRSAFALARRCWSIPASPVGDRRCLPPALRSRRRMPAHDQRRYRCERCPSVAMTSMQSAMQLAPVIADVIAGLEREPGVGLARMSGSGATCFGLFASRRCGGATRRRG